MKNVFFLVGLLLLVAACQPDIDVQNVERVETAVSANLPTSTPVIEEIPAGTQRNPYWDDFLDVVVTVGKVEGSLNIHTNGQQYDLTEFSAYISALCNDAHAWNLRWVLTLPDEIEMTLAQELFSQFVANDAMYLSVYANNPNGEWPRRDIGVELGANGPFRVITASFGSYPESLQAYVGDPFPNNYLVTNVSPESLGDILIPLLSATDRKHVRLQEAGSSKGLSATIYADTLAGLQLLEVETVSVYGIYTE